MRIGIDLSSLQGAHRMRGIGYTLINFINNMPEQERKTNDFVFYYYQDSSYSDPLEILNLKGMNYEIRPLVDARRIKKVLPRKFNLIIKALNQLLTMKTIYLGDDRIQDLKNIDVFLQSDQMISLPGGRGFRKAFIAYDVIPYVLEWDYLWNYKTARLHGLPKQAAVRCSFRRWMYIHKLRVNSRRADKIISISDATREDYTRYISSSKKKIITVPLGVNVSGARDDANPEMFHYISSSWGYIRRPYKFSDTPFLLFVGGADERRKLDELVTAFNHLRAGGKEIKLVLAGDSMQGPMNISTGRIQRSLSESSYQDDIIFMGFVDDRQRDWLYQNALSFIFPSKYEGFGLPVLEAFSYNCPVISYPNKATMEVASDIPIYAENYLELIDAVTDLLDMSEAQLKQLCQRGASRSQDYSWQKTTSKIIRTLG